MTKDMTSGAITPLLIKFTIPLVLGNLFQLTYNAADSIIVGKFVGEDALAAVGTSNPLMTLAILFINGMCLGAGILVSTAFGAGDTKLVERQVSTTAIAGTVFSLTFSVLCVLLADPLLRLLQVPAAILPIAVNYLRIVFAGLIFTFFYNFLAATMRALGDSKSALYFLMISAVLNIGGDLFFVEALGWGSEGCALSTVLSEAACCLLCVVYIRYKVPVLQLGRRWLVYDGKLLRKTVSYGWASAMQQATVQLGKIAVQAIVNTMGVNAMAAFTAASRIDDACIDMAIHAIREGITEKELSSKVEHFFQEKGCDHLGFSIVAMGANGADPHHGTDGTVLKEGDSIVMDIGAPFNHYWCDMTRTVFYKSASEEQRTVYETVRRANEAAIAVVKPGVAFKEIDLAARKVIEDAGYGEYFTHRTGHSIGMKEHEQPPVSSECEVIAKPGMIFSIEPGIYLPGKFGVRVEDLVLVTEDGCEVLNKYPKDLIVVE